MGFEQLGNDLLVTWRSRGVETGLRPPRLVFPGAMTAPADEPLRIRAVVSASRCRITVWRGEVEHSDTRRLSPLTGWRNLIPTRGVNPVVQRLFDVIWTVGFAGYLLFAVYLVRALRSPLDSGSSIR